MKRRVLPLLVSLAAFSGCGYVGPVVPPSPQIPAPITDLAVVERGDNLIVRFTTPPRTTDKLAIRRFSELDLRVGKAGRPFDLASWEASSHPYQVNLPPENSADEARAVPMEDDSIPVRDWQGQHVAILVRTAVRKGGHYSDWSNLVELDVRAPLEPPTLKAEPTAAGYRLSWPSEGDDVRYNVLRQGPSDKAAVPIGSTDKNEYTDRTAAWDTKYNYQVVATRQNAESLPSEPVPVFSSDVFSPSVPTDISVSATNDSIEVSWNRSPEANVAGYYVYRGENGGPMQRQGALQPLPTYSDRHLERGKSYRYAVSAASRKGIESAQSAAVEISSPLQ